MLGIGKLATGGDSYLKAVAAGVEDHYLGAGEAPGVWLAGAEGLGLEGEVAPEDLRAVLGGRAPDGEQLAVAPPGRARVPGFALTFSAPKSVSLLHALGPAEVSGPGPGPRQPCPGGQTGPLSRRARRRPGRPLPLPPRRHGRPPRPAASTRPSFATSSAGAWVSSGDRCGAAWPRSRACRSRSFAPSAAGAPRSSRPWRNTGRQAPRGRPGWRPLPPGPARSRRPSGRHSSRSGEPAAELGFGADELERALGRARDVRLRPAEAARLVRELLAAGG